MPIVALVVYCVPLYLVFPIEIEQSVNDLCTVVVVVGEVLKPCCCRKVDRLYPKMNDKAKYTASRSGGGVALPTVALRLVLVSTRFLTSVPISLHLYICTLFLAKLCDVKLPIYPLQFNYVTGS